MPYDWMIEVLRDLRRFAETHRMPDVVARLDEARSSAEAEIARRRAERERAGPDG